MSIILRNLLKNISSALGALGREFESRSPDWLFYEDQTPPWEKSGKNK